MSENFHLENGILTIESGTEYLESEKFADRDDIVKVILPEGLKHISVACFTSCNNLIEINIPSTVKTIDDGAFLMCESLQSVSFPDGLEEIADLAFQCTALHKVTIPQSVKRIGEEAFFECSSLVEANVLGKETILEDDAFGSCYNLVKGYIAPGFQVNITPGSELLYSLLWAGCIEKHSDTTSQRASDFIKNNETVVMERIFKQNNTAAMSGIAQYQLLDISNIDSYVRTASDLSLTEITALLIKAKGINRISEDEFDL